MLLGFQREEEQNIMRLVVLLNPAAQKNQLAAKQDRMVITSWRASLE